MHAVLPQRLLTLLQHPFPELVDLLKFCQDPLVLKGVFVCLSQFPARKLALSGKQPVAFGAHNCRCH